MDPLVTSLGLFYAICQYQIVIVQPFIDRANRCSRSFTRAGEVFELKWNASSTVPNRSCPEYQTLPIRIPHDVLASPLSGSSL
jgi:hypothetical protein